MTAEPLPLAAADAARFAHEVRARLPEGGLFAGQDWRIAPQPFPLGEALAGEIANLGRILLQFNRAANLLYRQSVAGRQPAWIARWLDQGKPDWLIELQRHAGLKNELPRVLRPDLLLTEHGVRLTELDSVPGGIGLTAWMNQAYTALHERYPHTTAAPIGGADGMLKGFNSIFGDAERVHLMVSEESATYRPEMHWLALQSADRRFNVVPPDYSGFGSGDAVYRFFELFDTANVPAARALFAAATARTLCLTPPPKPLFEEKMLLALLWNRNLRGFWRAELGEAFLTRLHSIVPYTWIVDPTPLPPHAALPGLEIVSWDQLKSLSQRERDLILKVSGFSSEAWGARSVHLGSDLSVADWSAAVDRAIADFPTSPWVLQAYHKPRVVESAWFDFGTESAVAMQARARLCPYYFVSGEGDAQRAQLGGILATLCPADKKIIHGMKDAILAPCSV